MYEFFALMGGFYVISKRCTPRIERYNLNFRLYLARLYRK
ncbi:hypothetical protein CWC46_21635 [Prodigiosinella confusarubida]|uniref:Uncharacterized protein n=1 Tax=Serratia sp. (strain ATCC 39006) TaxID=104623 RepID=A0A2I5TC96_SERS3|nr:hypothetical protein CWC46_21635 [Serratia sp. ATCC 39006]AUH06483.1 hypothetical protein Ser39006_021625 [Serratia sp. ATCC 39006]